MKITGPVVIGFVLGSMVLTDRSMADVWDLAGNSDDTSGSRTQVSHGAVQVHDLGVRPGPVADKDWYKAVSLAYSSYEVIVEGMTGDLNSPNVAVERVDSSGTVLTPSSALPGGDAKSVSWQNTTSSVISDSYIRVSGATCGTSCTSDDQYTIRFFETTYSIPRFNNAGGQATILILQNTSPQDLITGNAYCWSTTGTLLATIPILLSAHKLLIVNTSGVAGLAGVGGSITISNDGHYGQLAGKTVAVEPSTGFTFDTVMVPLPL